VVAVYFVGGVQVVAARVEGQEGRVPGAGDQVELGQGAGREVEAAGVDPLAAPILAGVGPDEHAQRGSWLVVAGGGHRRCRSPRSAVAGPPAGGRAYPHATLRLMLIGIDFGLSVTDAVLVSDGRVRAHAALHRPGPASVAVLGRAVAALPEDASSVGLTGVTGGRSLELPDCHGGARIVHVAEPSAVGRGGLALA